MKAHLSQVRASFEQVGDDEEIENKMHAIGRRSVALESKLMQLRRELQQDIESSKDMVRIHSPILSLLSISTYAQRRHSHLCDSPPHQCYPYSQY